MDATEHLEEHVWKHPEYYGGHSPDGDYCIAAQTRDSDALTRSNYECILRDLVALAKEHDGPDREEASVYDFRAGHWVCGWIEYIIVKRDAPDAVLQAAGEIVCALSDYPVYDEEHFSELEHAESARYWEQASVADRVDMIQRSGARVSVFDARRDDFPGDGELIDFLPR